MGVGGEVGDVSRLRQLDVRQVLGLDVADAVLPEDGGGESRHLEVLEGERTAPVFPLVGVDLCVAPGRRQHHSPVIPATSYRHHRLDSLRQWQGERVTGPDNVVLGELEALGLVFETG